jgi:hypothetical protein
MRLTSGSYKVQKKIIQDQLDVLVIPEAEVAFDAGQKLEDLGAVWEVASLEDKHSLLLSMLDAVYLDIANTRSVVAIKPKPSFYPLFDSLGQRPNSTVRVLRDEALTNEPGSVSETELGTVLVETGEGRNHIFNICSGALSRMCLVGRGERI